MPICVMQAPFEWRAYEATFLVVGQFDKPICSDMRLKVYVFIEDQLYIPIIFLKEIWYTALKL